MCGVFGFLVSDKPGRPATLVESTIRHLAKAAESRGKDSSGLVLQHTWKREITVFKANRRITQLLQSVEVGRALREVPRRATATQRGSMVAMGHSRLVTNGSQLQDDNNQPVLKDGVIGIHNGIITNDAAIWAQHRELTREYEIDTELLLALVEAGLGRGHSIDGAVSIAGREVEGTFSVALLFGRLGTLALASTNG